jgi:transcriptional regulator with XRE-family HTH domain
MKDKHSYSTFNSLGEFLRYLRTGMNLTQRQVGSVVRPNGKYAWKFVSRIERGLEEPSLREREKLATALRYPCGLLDDALMHFFAN